jgi:hypothetical protein
MIGTIPTGMWVSSELVSGPKNKNTPPVSDFYFLLRNFAPTPEIVFHPTFCFADPKCLFFPADLVGTIPTGMGVVPDFAKCSENKNTPPVS